MPIPGYDDWKTTPPEPHPLHEVAEERVGEILKQAKAQAREVFEEAVNDAAVTIDALMGDDADREEVDGYEELEDWWRKLGPDNQGPALSLIRVL